MFPDPKEQALSAGRAEGLLPTLRRDRSVTGRSLMAPRQRIKWKRGKRREALREPHPARLIEDIARESPYYGTLTRGAVWLATSRHVAYTLDRACLGKRTGGVATAGIPIVPSGPKVEVVVRLSLEEAWYLANTVNCLFVYTPAPRQRQSVEDHVRELVRTGLDQGGACEAGEDNATGFGEPQGNMPGCTSSATEPLPGAQPKMAGLRIMSMDELWHSFRRLGGHTFTARCAAHLHFRHHGWLVRSGLQYGADFVLYQRHPSLVHSDCCVLLQPALSVDPGPIQNPRGPSLCTLPIPGVDQFSISQPSSEKASTASSQARESCIVATRRPAFAAGFPRWADVQALSRLCVQVNKALVVAHVAAPPARFDPDAPDCLSVATVSEVGVVRFNPLRHLEEETRAAGGKGSGGGGW